MILDKQYWLRSVLPLVHMISIKTTSTNLYECRAIGLFLNVSLSSLSFFFFLQVVKVSDATSHARAGMAGTAPYELVIGVSINILCSWPVLINTVQLLTACTCSLSLHSVR